jgi:hypothetical protein
VKQCHFSDDGAASGQSSSDPSDSPGTLTINQLLLESRSGLERVHASDLEREMAAGALVVDTLRLEVRRAIERLRFRNNVILGCIRQPGYILERSEYG